MKEKNRYNKFRMLRDEVTDQYVATIFKRRYEEVPKKLCFLYNIVMIL